MIYLDNNSSTHLDAEAFEAMSPWLQDRCGNPSSAHSEGQAARRAINAARSQIADMVHCEVDEIIFTSGATESNTMVLFGARYGDAPPRRILASAIEHASVHSALAGVREAGIETVTLPVDNYGRVTRDALAACEPQLGDLLSLHWVHNESGVVQDVEMLTRLARDAGALVHIDASQALGKVEVNAEAVGLHFLTLSAHKMHGPKGIGALIVRDGAALKPLWIGGHQEGGRRGGTENVPAIVGFGAAAVTIHRSGPKAISAMLRRRNRFEEALGRLGATIIAQSVERAPNTTLAAWPDLDANEILRRLDRAGVLASSGSACSSNIPAKSRITPALNLPDDLLSGVVRFSASRETTDDEIDLAIERIGLVIFSLGGCVENAWDQVT